MVIWPRTRTVRKEREVSYLAARKNAIHVQGDRVDQATGATRPNPPESFGDAQGIGRATLLFGFGAAGTTKGDAPGGAGAKAESLDSRRILASIEFGIPPTLRLCRSAAPTSWEGLSVALANWLDGRTAVLPAIGVKAAAAGGVLGIEN